MDTRTRVRTRVQVPEYNTGTRVGIMSCDVCEVGNIRGAGSWMGNGGSDGVTVPGCLHGAVVAFCQKYGIAMA